jgi:hypothetical protein
MQLHATFLRQPIRPVLRKLQIKAPTLPVGSKPDAAAAISPPQSLLCPQPCVTLDVTAKCAAGKMAAGHV